MNKLNDLALKLNIQHFATPVYPEANLQTRAVLDNFKEKSVDFTYRFEQSLRDFTDAIGVSNLMSVSEGMSIKLYGGMDVTLADGNVAEGDLIPLSKVTPRVEDTKEITLKKYRKSTSGEAIQKYGLDQAIDKTDAALVKEIQKNIRQELFTLIQSGSAQPNLNSANGLQGALASAWGALQTIFEDDAIRTIVFAHPNDIAQAIADKQMTLETAFGLQYYTDLTGTIVFSSTQVAQGTIYATAADNLVIAYIPAGTSELGRSFALTSDDTGFLGMTHFVSHETLTHQTLLVSGVLMFPERLDGVVKIQIAETPTV